MNERQTGDDDRCEDGDEKTTVLVKQAVEQLDIKREREREKMQKKWIVSWKEDRGGAVVFI